MDLAVGAKRVIVAMEHTTRDGRPRILNHCTYPLTAVRCVDLIVTNLAVIGVRGAELELLEVAPGVSPRQVASATGLYRTLKIKAREIAEQAAVEALREQAAFLAAHDELTGLSNRRAWLAAALDCPTGSIALFDADHFKRINDRRGHVFGDHVLQLVAARLKELVGDAGVVGRVGGEEFAVVFTTDQLSAVRTASSVVKRFSERPLVVGRDDQPFDVTLSAGIAHRAPTSDVEGRSHRCL